MGEVGDGILRVGAVESGLAANIFLRRLQAAADLGRPRGRKDADELPRQALGGILGSGIHASCVGHLDLGFFGGFIQGGIGNIVAIGCNKAQAPVPLRDIQPGQERAFRIGDNRILRTVARSASPVIAISSLLYFWSSTPLALAVRIFWISSAMYAPASTAEMPPLWILLTTVRRASGCPTLAR